MYYKLLHTNLKPNFFFFLQKNLVAGVTRQSPCLSQEVTTHGALFVVTHESSPHHRRSDPVCGKPPQKIPPVIQSLLLEQSHKNFQSKFEKNIVISSPAAVKSLVCVTQTVKLVVCIFPLTIYFSSADPPHLLPNLAFQIWKTFHFT